MGANALSPLLQTLTSVAAQVAELERQIDELTQAAIEQKARIDYYEDELRELRTVAARARGVEPASLRRKA